MGGIRLCNVLLKLLTKIVPSKMHFSFGTDGSGSGGGRRKNGDKDEDKRDDDIDDDDDEESAHIVFEARTFFDRFVVTPPGGDVPPMNEAFPESDKEASARSSGGGFDWDPSVTYSMSFNSMYLDLPIWRLRDVPVMRDTSLATFWGEGSMLRIVLYEKMRGSATLGGGGRKADNGRHVRGGQSVHRCHTGERRGGHWVLGMWRGWDAVGSLP